MNERRKATASWRPSEHLEVIVGDNGEAKLGVPQASPIDIVRGALRAAKIGADKDIPHLTSALIDKYVADLRLLGLV